MYTQYPDRILSDDGTAIPLDTDNAMYVEFLEWVAAGNSPASPPVPTLEQRAAGLLAAVDALLNGAAQAKGYDSIMSAAVRAALPGSQFHAEGLAFGTWMDQVYATCYRLLAQVKAGEIPEPSEAELIAMLPVLVLPT